MRAVTKLYVWKCVRGTRTNRPQLWRRMRSFRREVVRKHASVSWPGLSSAMSHGRPGSWWLRVSARNECLVSERIFRSSLTDAVETRGRRSRRARITKLNWWSWSSAHEDCGRHSAGLWFNETIFRTPPCLGAHESQRRSDGERAIHSGSSHSGARPPADECTPWKASKTSTKIAHVFEWTSADVSWCTCAALPKSEQTQRTSTRKHLRLCRNPVAFTIHVSW